MRTYSRELRKGVKGVYTLYVYIPTRDPILVRLLEWVKYPTDPNMTLLTLTYPNKIVQDTDLHQLCTIAPTHSQTTNIFNNIDYENNF